MTSWSPVSLKQRAVQAAAAGHPMPIAEIEADFKHCGHVRGSPVGASVALTMPPSEPWDLLEGSLLELSVA